MIHQTKKHMPACSKKQEVVGCYNVTVFVVRRFWFYENYSNACHESELWELKLVISSSFITSNYSHFIYARAICETWAQKRKGRHHFTA